MRNVWSFDDLLALRIYDPGGPIVWIDNDAYWKVDGVLVDDDELDAYEHGSLTRRSPDTDEDDW